jgi:transcriptional regulator with XRE-family HTH domain
MSFGYSADFVQRVRAASRSHIGVRLAKFCIANNISVASVAGKFKVSRATVYKWFVGDTNPSVAHQEQIHRFIGD